MRAVGIDYDIIVDMLDYTWEFFDDVLKAADCGDKHDAVLFESMNDENKSNSIVYHFKVCQLGLSQESSTDTRTDDDQLIHAASVRSL